MQYYRKGGAEVVEVNDIQIYRRVECEGKLPSSLASLEKVKLCGKSKPFEGTYYKLHELVKSNANGSYPWGYMLESKKIFNREKIYFEFEKKRGDNRVEMEY